MLCSNLQKIPNLPGETLKGLMTRYILRRILLALPAPW